MMRASLIAIAVIVSGSSVPSLSAAPVYLTNATTEVVVNGGEADNGLVPADGYFRYTDLATAEETTWSIDPLLVFADGSTAVLSNGSTGGFGSPSDIGGGVVESTASAGGILVTAHTTLAGVNAHTVFSFSSTAVMDGTQFVFYAENDLFGFADDVATFTGSIAGGDLVLYQYDSAGGGLAVKLDGVAGTGASLTLFGSGIWTGFGTDLELGDLSVLSADGSNFVSSGDIGLALGFSLIGTSATIEINYSTVPRSDVAPPVVPEPTSLALAGFAGIGMAVGAWRRRRQEKPQAA